MPRTAEQYEEIRKEKRQLIVAAALRLFADKGYASTSISMIAKEAGISKGLLYNYFESKEELMKTIVTDLVTELTDKADANKDGKVDDEEMGAIIDYYFELFQVRRDELKLYYQLTFQPEVMEYMRSSRNMQTAVVYMDLFRNYFKQKYRESYQLVLLDFMSTLKGFAQLYVFAKETFPEEAIENYKDFLKYRYINNL